jgi:hypothetical protein
MQVLGRPRAAVTPILGVAVSAAIFLVVAVSVALQPPDTSNTEPLGAVLAWARTLMFCAGLLAFVAAMVAFSRADAVDEPVELLTGAGVIEDEEDVTAFVASPPVPAQALPPVEEAPMRFTMIALGSGEDDARAIADFGDADGLLAALRAWRVRYPEEEVRVFGPDGALLAWRAAVPEPVAEPSPVFRRVLRPGLATGGAA